MAEGLTKEQQEAVENAFKDLGTAFQQFGMQVKKALEPVSEWWAEHGEYIKELIREKEDGSD